MQGLRGEKEPGVLSGFINSFTPQLFIADWILVQHSLRLWRPLKSELYMPQSPGPTPKRKFGKKKKKANKQHLFPSLSCNLDYDLLTSKTPKEILVNYCIRVQGQSTPKFLLPKGFLANSYTSPVTQEHSISKLLFLKYKLSCCLLYPHPSLFIKKMPLRWIQTCRVESSNLLEVLCSNCV